jgi:hypothetical protein
MEVIDALLVTGLVSHSPSQLPGGSAEAITSHVTDRVIQKESSLRYAAIFHLGLVPKLRESKTYKYLIFLVFYPAARTGSNLELLPPLQTSITQCSALGFKLKKKRIHISNFGTPVATSSFRDEQSKSGKVLSNLCFYRTGPPKKA